MLVEVWFIAMALLTLVSAIMVLRVRELVHATIWLATMLLGVAGVFLTLGAEFLAIIQVLVYVGAVITLILFTVMLTVPEEKVGFLEGLRLPPGVSVESIEDIQAGTPAFSGTGPYADLKTTNPRRPQKAPDNLYGVGLADNEYGTEFTPREKKEGK
jgi:NADH-ubiquinone/plastoquinone oxidoreductase chain 6